MKLTDYQALTSFENGTFEIIARQQKRWLNLTRDPDFTLG